MSARRTAAFVGVGHSRVMRHDDVPLGVLAIEAARAAIADAGLTPDMIDGIACAPTQPFASEGIAYEGRDYVSINLMMRALGLNVRWGVDVNGLIAHSLAEAISAVEAGRCEYALVFRALHSPQGSYGHTSGDRATGGLQHSAPYGVFPPAIWAQMWSRYQDRYNSGSREQMSTFVIQERQNGLLWEHSYWGQFRPTPLTREEYLDGRVVSTPLSIFDCDIPVQGAAAFVITTADRATGLPHSPAHVLAVSAPQHPRANEVQSQLLDTAEKDGRFLAAQIWGDSGLAPKDIRIANVYDGFSIVAMLWLEAFGFCGAGEAFEFIQGGRIALDGALPLNTAGGNLGSGRMHGVPHFMDGVLQVMGRSGPRQVPAAEVVLSVVGPLSGGGAILFGRQPA